MGNFRLVVLLLLAIIAFLEGCGPAGLEEQRGEGLEETALTLETVTQEMTWSNGGSWASPDQPTPLSSTSDRTCFFTRIRGHFDSGADSVRILASRGIWDVGGSGATKASAGCAVLSGASEYTPTYEWVAGQRQPTNLGSTGGRVCFLTRVGGSFKRSGDWVGVSVSGGSWILSGASQGRDGYARARCVTVSSYSGEYAWNQGQGHPTYMGRAAGRVCALTYMAGQFDGDSESIEITHAAGYWFLGGSSARSGVAARARCF